MTTREEVVSSARGWLGSPWRHQGRARNGVDCGGLLIEVARELGMADVDTGAYPMTADGRSLRALCERYMEAIQLVDLQPADVVLLRFKNAPAESHVALVTDYRRDGLALLHSLNRRGVAGVIEHRMDSYWRSLVTAAFRLPGIQ